MISAINSSPSFNGVVPVRVFIDGLETFDEKLIKSSCRQLSNILAGPVKSEPKLSLIRKFGLFDKDYSVEKGIKGFPKKEQHKSIHPSEFFRCIIDRSKAFFITGPQAEELHKLGKSIGKERILCKEKGIRKSFDLVVAEKNYFRTINNFIRNSRLRIAELINGKSTPLTLKIDMTSNEKYGLSTFKMHLSDIDFIK